jgi:hypothetical protein
MFSSIGMTGWWAGKWRVGAIILMVMLIMALSCFAPRSPERIPAVDYEDGVADWFQLALRFAPRLYLQAEEPYEIESVIPVFHPAQPVIAYHIFFEDDALYSKKGLGLDHELVWVRYDPVTLKLMDVITFWHRTTLRTDACLLDAKSNQQRPRIEVQWGQHGMLPWKWRDIFSVRPRLELALHYSLVAQSNQSDGAETDGGSPLFGGSYEQYLQFTACLDLSNYIREENIIIAEHPAGEIGALISGAYAEKKEWPHW